MYVLVDINCNLLDQGNFKSRKLNQILEFCQVSQLVDKPTLIIITKTLRLLLDVCINSYSEKIVQSDHDQVYLVRKKKNKLQKANTIEQTEFPLGFGRKTLGT